MISLATAALAAGALWSQITAPPAFEDNKTFRTGAAGPIDSSHVSSQREEISRQIVKLLRAYDLSGAGQHERKAFEAARALLDQGMAAGAAAAFEAAARRSPESQALGVGWAAGLFLKGEYDESASMLVKLAEKRPGDAAILPFLGEAAGLADRQKPAVIRALRRMKEAQAGSGAARFYLARLTEGDEAERLFREAARLDSRDARPCLELARLESAREQTGAAVEWLKEALARDPESAEAHYRLARLYHRTNQKELGDQHMEKFRELKKP